MDTDTVEVLIIEGLYLLFDGIYSEGIESKSAQFYRGDDTTEYWEEILSMSDFKIYVEGELEKCMARLCERNKCIPGYSEEEVRERV